MPETAVAEPVQERGLAHSRVADQDYFYYLVVGLFGSHSIINWFGFFVVYIDNYINILNAKDKHLEEISPKLIPIAFFLSII